MYKGKNKSGHFVVLDSFTLWSVSRIYLKITRILKFVFYEAYISIASVQPLPPLKQNREGGGCTQAKISPIIGKIKMRVRHVWGAIFPQTRFRSRY